MLKNRTGQSNVLCFRITQAIQMFLYGISCLTSHKNAYFNDLWRALRPPGNSDPVHVIIVRCVVKYPINTLSVIHSYNRLLDLITHS